MKAKHLMRVGAVAMAALLVACGADDSSSGGSAADPSGEPQAGGTLTAIQLVEPRSLDPAAMTNLLTVNGLVGNSLYGQLLTVDDGGEVQPGLAESLSTSDGGTTWTLQLREGLEFSDGTPLDAAAVEFNWARLRDDASLGSTSRGYAAFIASMSPSGQALDFTLTQPIGRFGDTIAAEALNWIAAPQALEAGPAAFDANPIGAGPFVLESWTRSGQMVLAKNPNYYDAPRPYLDKLVLTANGDGNQRFSTLSSGDVDAVVSSNPDLLAAAVEQGNVQVTRQDLGDAIVLSFNTRTAPFDDVRARQAVYMGVDGEMVNAAVYRGEAEVPETLFAEDSPDNGDARLPSYDPDAAQELFDELAADGHPVEFTINIFQSTQSRQVAEAIQAQLNQYDNVQVEVEVLDISAHGAKLAARDFQAAGNFLRVSGVDLYAQLFSTAGSKNVSGISDPELDEALLAGLEATDEGARTEAHQRVAERFSELVPSYNYTRSQHALVYTNRVHGVEMCCSTLIPTDRIWVSD